MLEHISQEDLFIDYYSQWVKVYKEGAIRKVTLDKYHMTCSWLEKLIPNLKLKDMTRINYQQLLNDYAESHERQTTMDFHHQLKGAILDAVDEGYIERDPTRKVIIKGKQPASKKVKYLNQFELHSLLKDLKLGMEISWDWFILLVAKTGMRFSEALALTPKDFDFVHQTLSINKTWDYKDNLGEFLPTKNKSSVRKIQIDWQIVVQFAELLKTFDPDKPIFVKEGQHVYNSTVNDILSRHCKKLNIPVISIHGLRHTHASLLLFAGIQVVSLLPMSIPVYAPSGMFYLGLLPVMLSVAAFFHLFYSYSRGDRSGGGIWLILSIAMVLLCGAFLPVSCLPEILQKISGFLPLTWWTRSVVSLATGHGLRTALSVCALIFFIGWGGSKS